MAQYGKVAGQFLAQDGAQTPLTGQIIFYPRELATEPGIDYPTVPITGVLNKFGELTAKDGSPLVLMLGEWRAVFLLRHEGRAVPIAPINFTLTGDAWITHTPGTGWSFEIVPNGDGTARLIAPEITMNNDGTATVRIA